jgi:hypothetical protein
LLLLLIIVDKKVLFSSTTLSTLPLKVFLSTNFFFLNKAKKARVFIVWLHLLFLYVKKIHFCPRLVGCGFYSLQVFLA